MHHSISDGATLIAVVSEIIKYTLNPKSKYKKDLKIDSLDKLSIEKSVLKELNKEKAFSGRNITRKSLISHKRRGVTTGFIYKSLEMNKLKNFIKKIKVDGIAFQSLFSSIVLKEFFKCNRIQKVGFICPINVRKFFGLPKHSLGCKITLLEVLITKAQSLSCKNLAFFIDKEVNLLVENRYKLCQNIYDLVSPFKMNIGSDPIRLGVSNVGKIEGFRYLEELGVNVVYINGVLGNKFVFHPVICKFQEQVNFSFSFSKFFFTQKEAERLSNNIINYIKNY